MLHCTFSTSKDSWVVCHAIEGSFTNIMPWPGMCSLNPTSSSFLICKLQALQGIEPIHHVVLAAQEPDPWTFMQAMGSSGKIALAYKWLFQSTRPNPTWNATDCLQVLSVCPRSGCPKTRCYSMGKAGEAQTRLVFDICFIMFLEYLKYYIYIVKGAPATNCSI